MLAARMFAEVEKSFGRSLLLGTLFDAPTIATLADILSRDDWEPRWASLVPIQATGDRRPFFCVHPPSGNILGLTELARCLGPHQPFYALQARGLDGENAPLTRIEDMTECYLREIRTVQDEGPYLLGGRSSTGGLVAFEMAQRLVAGGEDVALLMLIDPSGSPAAKRFRPGHAIRRRSIVRYPRRTVKRVTRDFKNLFDAQARRFQRVRDANEQANRSYVPDIYPGRIVVFMSEARRTRPRFDPYSEFGWAKLADGGLDFHVVPGTHENMLREPHVHAAAKQMKVYLDRAQTND
jgi:aspartate racemase